MCGGEWELCILASGVIGRFRLRKMGGRVKAVFELAMSI
jgi:hypothetical protein